MLALSSKNMFPSIFWYTFAILEYAEHTVASSVTCHIKVTFLF